MVTNLTFEEVVTDLARDKKFNGYLLKSAFIYTDNLHDAEDVVQEVYLRVLKRGVGKYDPNKNLRNLMRKMVRNVSTDYLRKKYGRRGQFKFRGEDSLEKIADKTDPLTDLSSEEKMQRVRRVLNHDRYRELGVLYSGGEPSYSEVAITIGIPIGTVKSRVNRQMIEIADELREFAAA